MKKIYSLLIGVVAWSGSTQAQITIYPYVEDFESEATCSTTAGAACVLTTTGYVNAGGDNIDWTVDVNGTGSTNTGPTANGGADHNPGVAGGKYLYTESSAVAGNPGSVAWLESPEFDFSGLTAPSLGFWYHMFGATMGTLQVDISTDLGVTWTPVVAPFTDNQDVWQYSETSLLAYAGNASVMFRWHGITGTSFTSDMAIDDISVFEPDPFDLAYDAVDSISVSICASAGYQGYASIIHQGSVPIAAGDSVHVTWNDGTNTFTDAVILTAVLNPGDTLMHPFSTLLDFSVPGTYNVTTYINYAADNTLTNDTLTAAINASPLVNSFPYLETFAAGNGGWIANNAANGNWELGMPNQGIINTAYSDTMSWMTGLNSNYNSGSNSWVEGPCFDFTNATGEEWVSMAIYRETEDSWDGSNLTYSTDGGNTWSLLGNFGDPNWYTDNSINGNPGGSQEGWEGTGNGWEITKHKLDSATFVGMSDVKFRVNFGSDGSVTQQGIAWDNFAISYPPSADIFADTVAVCDTLYAADAGTGWEIVEWSTGTVDQMDTLTSTGQYVVTLTDSFGLCATDTFELVLSTFIPPNLADWDFVCKGDTLWLDAGTDTLNAYTYAWSTTETTQIIGVNVGGLYIVTKDNGICSASDTIDVILPPVANLGGQTTEICAGQTVVLDAGVTGAFYNWTTNETTQTIVAPGPGAYAVTVVDTFGCLSTSATSVVDGTPTVILGNDLIICADDIITLDAGNSGLTYLWSTGETTQTITIDGSVVGAGTYTYDVTVTSAAGCTGTDAIDILINPCTGVEEALSGVSVEIYPNPTNGQLTINVSDLNQTEMVISVLNLQGQVIEARQINNGAADYVVNFDLTELASGMYMIKFENENGSTMQRVVKN